MKKSVLILIALVSIVSINAQTKVAHINTQKLLDTLPSRKVALKQISEFQQKGEMELKDMEADLQKTYQKYMAEQNTKKKEFKKNNKVFNNVNKSYSNKFLCWEMS